MTLADKYCQQGHKLVEEGKYKAAGDVFWQATLLDPSHWEAWFNFGLICYCRGEFEESKQAHLKYSAA